MSCKPDKNGSWKRLSDDHYLNTKTCEELGIRQTESRSELYLAYKIQPGKRMQDISKRPETKTNAIATLKNFMR